MSQKPAIPKGTRDFLPQETARRSYIFETIRSVFKRYGYAPIETPSFELSSTLMGKYGEEGDKLIFRILRSGNYLSKTITGEFNENLTQFEFDKLEAEDRKLLAQITSKISEKALRYDLTVPFARFVVQHQNELTFPFKRYQIQPVWRADRPQRGRYQEFWQCDVDVVGSDSLVYEVELVQIFDEALSALQIPSFTIKINNRKILSGIAEVTGEQENLVAITVAIDKLDKIGREGVEKELREKGISEEAIQKIAPLFDMTGTNTERLAAMENYLADSETGLKGIEELRFVLDQVEELGLEKADLEFDVTLARGLNYYTGAIFEVKANGVVMGSICGGGRYDDLTGLFGMKGMSGVGVSFGADRIYDILTELKLFPESIEKGLTLMFVNFGPQEQKYVLPLLKKVRQAGIDAEIYPTSAKLQKQMKYANDRKVQYTALIGETEMQKGLIQLKNMQDGTQSELTINELIEKIA